MTPTPLASAQLIDLAGDVRVALTLAVRRIRLERSDDAITDGQYAVLAHLANHGPLTPSRLADLEHVQPPPMTRTVNCLVDAGLVAREQHPTDGRQVLVRLTAAGMAEVTETRRRRNAWLAGRLAELPPDEREVLTRATEILRRITTT